MNEYIAESMDAARELADDLRALGDVPAPRTLRPGVLRRLGLGDAYVALPAPIGTVYVAYNERGVSMVTRVDDDESFERAFRAHFGRPIYPADEPPAALAAALREQLEGAGRPALRFDLRGLSEFERAVLLKALEIPRGEVRPYAWIAREIGSPRAVRAVGTALAHNPVPLLIPCHRVVRSDGHLGQYSLGGPETKRAILAVEGLDPAALERQARLGVRYWGSDTTRVYCFPTCRHARRITDSHRVTFGSAAAAEAAEYRPCKVCRPAVAS